MSDKAEAWEAWFKANGAFHTPYWKQTAQEKFNAGWDAAQADTEAKVRAAVEATIEEAAKVCKPIADYPSWSIDSDGTRAMNNVRKQLGNLGESVMADIRALDASAIVARVMHKEEQ